MELRSLIPALFLCCACAGGEESSGQPETATVQPASSSGLQLIFMGGPGAGKGTQAARLEERHGIPHISTGRLLRDEVARGTELGQRVEGIMQRGELVDDETVLDLVRNRG